MAALFFTNHRMNDVTRLFKVWHKAALRNQGYDNHSEDPVIVDHQSSPHLEESPVKKVKNQPINARAVPAIEIDTELANQNFENYQLENQMNNMLSESQVEVNQLHSVDPDDIEIDIPQQK